MNAVAVLKEWSEATPATHLALRKRVLSDADKRLVDRLRQTSTIRIDELRDGVRIVTEHHVGTIQLGSLRVTIAPKIKTRSLMEMVARTLDLDSVHLFDPVVTVGTGDNGFVDLLGLALAREGSRIAQRGHVRGYVSRTEDIGTVRGRVDLGHWVRHPGRSTLRCTYDDLTADLEANRILAAGLGLASQAVSHMRVSADLARLGALLGQDLDLSRQLTISRIDEVVASLDRRTSHYRVALDLVRLFVAGTLVNDQPHMSSAKVTSFLLDMNMLFERFVGRVLIANAPRGLKVFPQKPLSGAYQYVVNRSGWPNPIVRPDFVVTRDNGATVALADAKYKDRVRFPPSTADLYQLTVYGLAFDLPEPRTVVILYPLGEGDRDIGTVLQFVPDGGRGRVTIRQVGVPLAALATGGKSEHFWPFDAPTDAPSGVARSQAAEVKTLDSRSA